VLIPLITWLFTVCLASFRVPDEWKTCLLSVIPKGKGEITDPSSWRGISMKCVLGKLLSAVVARRLYAFLERTNVIPREQHGFVAGRSTETAMTELVGHVRGALTPQRGHIYAAFLDFRAAFDTASRRVIIDKLSIVGVGGRFLRLIADMLSENKVLLNDGIKIHPPFTQKTGLPQGDTISSLLFVVLLYDLPAHIIGLFPNVKIILYADDIVLLANDILTLTAATKELMSFCGQCGLELNIRKSKAMKFRRGGRLARTDRLVLTTGEIDFVSEFTYLGFLITSRLTSFSRHIEVRRRKALLKVLELPDLRILSLSTALELFRLKIAPCAIYGIRLYWQYLSEANLNTIDSIKTTFLKRTLGISKFARNRAVYLMAGCPTFIEDIAELFQLQKTEAMCSFLAGLEVKMASVDPEIFRTQALISQEWKHPLVRSRHITCRTAAHGFHHRFCTTETWHEANEMCTCRFCGLMVYGLWFMVY
jgi:hypothetical protein